jgi:hypothetical protein
VGISVWTLKANVLAALTALTPADADIVQIGLPVEAPSNQSPRRIYILNVSPDTPVPVFEPSTQIRREEYVLPLMLEVLSFSGNALDGQSTVLTAMQALWDAVHDILLADTSWGAAVHQSGLSLQDEVTGPIADMAGGWAAQARVYLHVMRQGA